MRACFSLLQDFRRGALGSIWRYFLFLFLFSFLHDVLDARERDDTTAPPTITTIRGIHFAQHTLTLTEGRDKKDRGMGRYVLDTDRSISLAFRSLPSMLLHGGAASDRA